MKKILIIPFCAIAALLVIAGCKKGILDYGDETKVGSDQALLRINYNSQYANNRSVIFRINGVAVNAPILARAPFPGGGYNTNAAANTADFLAVPSGTINFSVAQPKKINDGTDSIVLYKTTLNLDGGKNYTVHIADTAATTKSLLTVENLARPDTSNARMHFVNLMPNVPSVDLYYGTTTGTTADQSSDVLVAGNVGFMQSSDDFLIKIAGTNGSFKIRATGQPKTAAGTLAYYTSTSVPVNQRVFTAFASGYSGKTNTQKPYITFFLVR